MAIIKLKIYFRTLGLHSESIFFAVLRTLFRKAKVLFFITLVSAEMALAFLGMNTNAFMQGSLPWWHLQFVGSTPGSTFSARFYTACTDASGNLYAAGMSDASVDGNPYLGSVSGGGILMKFDSTGTKLWSKSIGVRGFTTYIYSLSTEPGGNILIAGYTSGGLDGNTLSGAQDAFVSKLSPSGALLWTRQLGGAAASTTTGYGVAADSSGNVFLAGNGNGALSGSTQTGVLDLFLAKYDSSGVHQWTRQLGVAAKSTNARGVAISTSGDAYVAGYTNGGLDGNTLASSQDFFVTKYDNAGTKQWTRQMGAAASFSTGSAVTTNSIGDVLIAGNTNGGLNGNTLTGSYDAFLASYNSAGTVQWVRQLGVAAANSAALSVRTDTSDNIFISGMTPGNLDGNTLTGTQDMFITKYNGTGTKQWTKLFGSALKTASGLGVAPDLSGNIYVAGTTSGGLDGNTQSGGTDCFVTKYDATGLRQWTKQFGIALRATSATSVTTDGSTGSVYGTGQTAGGFDGNLATGTSDFYVWKASPQGVKQWVRQLGVATKATSGTAAAADATGNVYVVGTTNGALDGNTLTGTQDLFIAKYDTTGLKQWTRLLGVATKSVTTGAAATDASSNIFAVGTTPGGLDGNTLTGTQDVYVTKFNSAGTKQWTRELGVATLATNGNSAATDSTGNVFVGGYTTGGLDGNTLTGTQDFYVIKYNSAGTKQWTRQLGAATKATTSYASATDSAGNVYLVGQTNGNLDGNTVAGTQDYFLTKYNGTGVKQWTKQVGVAGTTTSARSITIDRKDNIYVVGSTTAGLEGSVLAGTADFFMAKYRTTGVRQWTKQLGLSSVLANPVSTSVNALGDLFILLSNTGGIDGTMPLNVTSGTLLRYGGN